MKKTITGWPNGKRIALAVTVMLETWPEGKSSSLLTPRVKLNEGVMDHQSRTWGEYGGRAGVWRIIRILDQCGVPATFCTNARCAEIFPDAIAQIIRSGHDIAAHAYMQDELLPHLAPKQERELIHKCIDVLATRSGARPQGWLSPKLAWTAHTDEFLAEEKLLWRGDANYIDLPRRVTTPHGMIAHIPHSDYTDNRVLPLSPRQYFDTYRDTFDYLYANEPMALLVMTVHCHFGGRPLMSAVFNNLLRYFAGYPEVWFARHNELARWTLEGETDEITNAERFFPGH